jgi:hypothetical protein
MLPEKKHPATLHGFSMWALMAEKVKKLGLGDILSFSTSVADPDDFCLNLDPTFF